MEPVEPAAITGPSPCAASRTASALISASRRAAGSMAPSFGEDFRPGFTRDLQEFQRELPVTVERFGYEPIQPLPGHAARGHVVHQAREVIGKRECRGRIIGDERRLAVLIGCNACRPFEHQPREQQAPLKAAERRWQLERLAGQRSCCCVGERDLVLVDIADRDDPRQDRRVLVGRLEEEVAREPAGAPRRQVERGVRQRERRVRRRKARHEGSIDQRVDERRHERHRGRDGEHLWTSNHCAIGLSCLRVAHVFAARIQSPPRWRSIRGRGDYWIIRLRER